jgi:hypothetical protein
MWFVFCEEPVINFAGFLHLDPFQAEFLAVFYLPFKNNL